MHDPYIRIVPGSSTAVLMVHGILGSPRQFDFLLPAIPENWSVYNVLLDGHGKGVQDFSDTSMLRWEQQVRRTLSKLTRSYTDIVLVGHSMGTLLLLDAARYFPERIRALFLLNVPLTATLKPEIVENSLKNMLDMVSPDDIQAVSAQNACSIDLVKTPWSYLGWLPRYLELFQKMHDTPPLLEHIQVPCFAFHSRNDELVAKKSLSMLQKHAHITTSVLEHSGHFYYAAEDQALMCAAFERLCAEIL